MAIVDVKHTQTIEEAFNSVAEGGSGGGIVYINDIYNEDDGTHSLDASYNELKAIIDDGRLPVCIYRNVDSIYSQNRQLAHLVQLFAVPIQPLYEVTFASAYFPNMGSPTLTKRFFSATDPDANMQEVGSE